MAAEDKFQAGEAYGNGRAEAVDLSHDPVEIATDLLKHSVSLRSQVSVSEAANLISDLLHAGVGEPLDDKKGTTELLIGILTSLPATSKSRTLLTNRFIEKLWNNLQHPPQTFVGGEAAFQAVDSPAEPNGRAAAAEETAVEFTVPDTDVVVRQQTAAAAASSDGLYQYRTPDGSCNNVLSPELGKAGSAYARTVRATERLQGVKPDPGLLFDLLMARDDAHFRENPAGISSMFFYHASIIIHDVFRTSPADGSRVETSSYLDLAPLYGSSLRDQLEVRTLRGGKLKPDAFHERRLLGQPVGMSVMLVLYNRFHNHVCDVLLQINEGGRFGLACADDAGPRERALALAKQDHDLFNTARLIVGGLYVNVSLHDYLRAITNTHHSTSDWTLDPRAEMARQAHGPEPAPRGVGNQVSVEFNLLYRFHACISRRDERWLNDFLLRLFPGRRPDELEKLSAADFGEALHAWRAAVPADPAARDIGELKRQPDGSFRDEDLVRVLAESMADPAAAFGARMVPKALRIVEVLGIRQARRWQVASLNEFRAFFGLRRYEAFSEINSDPDVAAALEKLYTDPDMVELYPGLMVEDVKPVRSPGCGICPTYSVGRAILSDAITLVRGDRFNTVDYSVANLTNWGYHEVQPDPKTLGGSVLYRLIQRGLPGWFPFNSVAVMQPFYTPEANERIARELGTMAQT
ncbi:hypothetical protein CDD83_10692 [Cordyceps sp. RAO-2017]|nr:hypothetical protein CDD83_10692 [Cordyceps sp. RAO-2017]